MSAGRDEHGATAEPGGSRDDDVRGTEDRELLGRQGTAQAGGSECDHPADRRLGGRLEQVAGDETTQAVADDVDDGCASGIADRVDGAMELPRELGVVEPRLVGEGHEVPEPACGEETAESPEMTGIPEETMDDLRHTAAFFVDSLRYDHADPQLSILAPLADTPIQKQYRDSLVLNDDVADMSYRGWHQEPQDHAMIAGHPEIFPSFYSVR